MAESDNDLIFSMKLSVNVGDLEEEWKKHEASMQKVLDKNPLKVNLVVDDAKLRDALAQLSKINSFAPKQSTQAALVKANITGQAQATKILNQAEMKLNIDRERLRASTASADKAELSLMNARSKSVSSIYKQNDAYKKQSTLLTSLKQSAAAYISVMGAYRLGRNIVETTAEFEMQRVALAAIIQNKQKADKIFAQTVELGIQSPFMIKQLITAEKQLSAYRIETENLFDTTKRLADISAGLGVSMERLILAYGQVKAASVLRGQEIRQFTEAGIPIVQLLADKFTKLNGVATTTTEVFDLVSKRLVPFEMVKEVFEEMTDAGGVFYRMQEIQAETLKGKISNLRDAMDKMFMEIGNQGTDSMKSIIDGIRVVMDNWQIMFGVAQNILLVMAALKVSSSAYSAVMGKQNVAALKTVMANKQKEASMLRQIALVRKLTFEEQVRLATSSKLLISDYKQMIQSGSITKDTIYRYVATKKLNAEQAKAILINSSLAETEKAIILSRIASASQMNAMTFSIKRLGLALGTAAKSAWKFVASMAANPLTWVAVAAAGVAKLISSVVRYHKEYKQLHEDMAKISRSTATEMEQAWENVKDVVSAGMSMEADEKQMVSARKSLQDILSKNELIKNVIDSRLESLTSEKDKLSEINDIWSQIQKNSSGGDNPMAYSLKSTGSFFEKDAIERTKQMNKEIEKLKIYFKVQRKAGVNVTPLRKEFEALWESFDQGTITLEEFSVSMKSIGDRTGQTNYLRDAFNQFGKIGQLAEIASSQWNEFTETYLKDIDEINSQKIDITNPERYGLTEANFKELQARIADFGSKFIKAQGDIADGVSTVIANTIRGGGKFSVVQPKTPPLGAFAESYNAFIAQMGLTNLAALTEPTQQSEFKDTLKKLLKSDRENLDMVTNALKNTQGKTKEFIDKLKAEQAKYKKDVESRSLVWTMFFGEEDDASGDVKGAIRKIGDNLKIVEEAYKEFINQRKWFSEEVARQNVEEKYGGQGVPLAFNIDELSAAFDNAIELYSQFGADAAKEANNAFLKQQDYSFNEQTAQIKEKLSVLAKEVEQTQKANEFYEKMLGLTGSKDVATILTERMGFTVGSVRAGLLSALKQALGKDVDFDNFQSMQDAITKMPSNLQSDAQKLLDNLMAYDMKNMESIYSGLSVFMSAEKQKEVITAETEANILKIRESAIESEQEALIEAEKKKGEQAKAKIDFEELRASEDFVRAFGDLGRVGETTLRKVRSELENMSHNTSLTATDLKTITGLIQQVDTELEDKDPFDVVTKSVKKYAIALKELNRLRKEEAENAKAIQQAEDNVAESLDELVENSEKMKTNFDKAASAIDSVISLSEQIAESLGITFSEETQEYVDAFSMGIQVASTALGVFATVAVIAEASMWPLVAAAAAIGAVFMAIKGVGALINLKDNNNLKRLADTTAELEKTAENLAKATDDMVGSDYIKNMQAQIKANEELIRVEKERIETLEKKKYRNESLTGIKAWKTIKEIEEATASIEEYTDAIEELNKEFMREMTGFSGAADAATSFADSWFNAYLSTEDTFSAMTDNFDEMINNMVVKSILAKVVAARLDPLFAAIETAYADGDLDGGELSAIQRQMGGLSKDLDEDLTEWMRRLQIAGFEPSVSENKKSLTGISASVASMSEDTALLLGGYLNAGLMQWIQQTSIQTNIHTGLREMYSLQQQSMATINGIKSDTAFMVSHLATLAATTQNGGTRALNVRLI